MRTTHAVQALQASRQRAMYRFLLERGQAPLHTAQISPCVRRRLLANSNFPHKGGFNSSLHDGHMRERSRVHCNTFACADTDARRAASKPYMYAPFFINKGSLNRGPPGTAGGTRRLRSLRV